jgi:subtilisin family serine protease
MNLRRLIMPWAHQSDLYSVPGRLILKLALGEAPEAIPSAFDVRAGTCDPALKIEGGAVDRILKSLGGAIHGVVRVHAAAASINTRGGRHKNFDDLEHATGLSRILRVDVDRVSSIHELVDALSQPDHVEHASPDYLTALPFARTEEGAFDSERAWLSREQVCAPKAMAYEPGDPAVIVAIVDTGIEAEHPELRRRFRPGLSTVELSAPDLANGVHLVGDYTHADRDPDDAVGHGTSCACIVGARGDRIPPGLAGDSGRLAIRVLAAGRLPGKSEPVGIGAISDIDCGIKIAIDLGAKVLNMSFGTPQSALAENDPLPHQEVIRYGAAHGCVMLAASGNSGKEERFFPAAHEEVIAVGAVDPDGRPSHFSTTGDHVALCAPGERIVSGGLHGYEMVTGTSFAAPFAAATAALLVSRAERRANPVEGATVKRILRQSARQWSTGQNRGCGTGVLDAIAALRELDREIDWSRSLGPSRQKVNRTPSQEHQR